MVGPNMASVLRRVAARYPRREALIFNDERYTYGQFNERVNQLAHGFLDWGLSKGDVVAIFSQNCNEYLEAYFACAKTGCILNILNWRLAADEILYMMQQSRSQALLVAQEYQDFFRPLLPRLDEALKTRILVIDGGSYLPGAVDYEEFIRARPSCEPVVAVDGEDPVLLLYTSGTTGLPKGALLTQSNWVWDALAHLYHFEYRSGDKLLVTMPFVHVSGIHMGTNTFILKGLPIVIQKAFEPQGFCELVQRERCTAATTVITPVRTLLDHPEVDRYDLSSLRLLLTAAGPYDREFGARALYKLGVSKFLFGYGLTEASPCVTLMDSTGEVLFKENALGWPVWTVDVRVVNPETGEDVPEETVGELLVRGPNVFKGYLGMPDATDQALRGGWLWTGDLVRRDGDGCFFFVDRTKDMIKSGGENVYSAEVEGALLRHNPSLAEAVVVAIPDPRWGEAVTAVCVVRPGKETTEEEVRGNLRGHLAGFKIPKSVQFVAAEDLPRTVSGKVQKRLLRQRLLGKQ